MLVLKSDRYLRMMYRYTASVSILGGLGFDLSGELSNKEFGIIRFIFDHLFCFWIMEFVFA
jgi:hypothetical protein